MGDEIKISKQWIPSPNSSNLISKAVDAAVNKLILIVVDAVADIPHCFHSDVATAARCYRPCCWQSPLFPPIQLPMGMPSSTDLVVDGHF